MKIQIGILFADLKTYTGDEGPIPWRFSESKTTFKYPPNSDSYPIKGIKNLPKDCMDYRGIINSDADFQALQQFYSHIESIGFSNKAGLAEATRLKDNPYDTGHQLYKQYIARVIARSNLKVIANASMATAQALPHQVYENYGFGGNWPPPTKANRGKNDDVFVLKSSVEVGKIAHIMAEKLFGEDALTSETTVDAITMQCILEPLLQLNWDRFNKAGRNTVTERENAFKRVKAARDAFLALGEGQRVGDEEGVAITEAFYKAAKDFEHKCAAYATAEVKTFLEIVTVGDRY